MRAVMKGFALTGSKLPTQRAFGEREWAHVLRCVDAELQAAGRRRLHCLLELLVSSGVRRDALAKARHADLEVPLADEVVTLLDAGAHDVLGDVDGDDWDASGQGGSAERPLIHALGASRPAGVSTGHR